MGEQEPFNRNEFIYRVGTFFLVVATGLLIFFLFSESLNAPQIDLFCWSTVLFVVGFMFRAQYKKTVTPSGRFSIFNRSKSKPKEEKAKSKPKEEKTKSKSKEENAKSKPKEENAK